MAKHLSTRRAAAAATTAVSLVAGAVGPIQASEIQRAYAEHTRSCIGLFLSDKDRHTANCLPNIFPSTSGEGTSGSPVLIVVAPPPPPGPVVIPDSSYPPVGSSYPDMG